MTRALRRTLAALIVALAFGMLAALVKGDQAGLRDTIGNLSTPWLLVAFGAGRLTRSLPRGALLGLAATVLALLGFYLVVAVITDDAMPTLHEHLEHVLRVNRRWLISGLLSGPLFGALGAWARRLPRRAALVIVGLLLIVEPFVIGAVQAVPGGRQIVHWSLHPGPYVAEIVAGLAVLLLARRRRAAEQVGH